MMEAIVKEIQLTEVFPSSKQSKIKSLYFGGGTPSILCSDDLNLLFNALKSKFEFANDIEITLEANPDDISHEKLESWKLIGINRLSVGIQSFVEEELIWMNRAHTAAESISCIDKITEAGFSNFSIDLIYGSPVLTDEDWKRNVEIVISKNIPHISCYALTVEPKTALDKMIAQHKKETTDPDKQARHFLQLMDWMKLAGYEHYEISNFAKPGFRSKHNSSYWQGESYYAFGPSAHAFDGKSRRWNIANNALYIQSLQNNSIPFEEEQLSTIQQLNEYIMTSLRTMEGINLDYVAEHFGESFSADISKASIKHIHNNNLQLHQSNLILTQEGKLFADGIAADLFFMKD